MSDGTFIISDWKKTSVWRGSARVMYFATGCKVTALAELPGGLVALADQEQLCVWEIKHQAKCVQMFSDGHESAVNALAVLPDSKLVSGSDDGSIRIWNTTTGKSIQTLATKAMRKVLCLIALPGDRLAAGLSDRIVRVWHYITGALLFTLDGHRSWPYALALLPEGHLVSVSSDRTLRVWDFNTGQSLKVINTESKIYSLVVRQDGTLATGSLDGAVEVWQ
jgi:WD40 repeat protein